MISKELLKQVLDEVLVKMEDSAPRNWEKIALHGLQFLVDDTQLLDVLLSVLQAKGFKV